MASARLREGLAVAVGMAAPRWARELRAAYLRGASTVFILQHNDDVVLHGGRLLALRTYLETEVLARKDLVVRFDPATGISSAARGRPLPRATELHGVRAIPEAFTALDATLRAVDGVAVIIEQADLLLAGEDLEETRVAIGYLRRWAVDPELEAADNLIVILSSGPLPDALTQHPRVRAVAAGLPDQATRARILGALDPSASEHELQRLAAQSGGMSAAALRDAVVPGDDGEGEARLQLLGDAVEAPPVAARLAKLLSGTSTGEVRRLIDGGALAAMRSPVDASLFALGAARARAVEVASAGALELVPPVDLSRFGGQEAARRHLTALATAGPLGGIVIAGAEGSGKSTFAIGFASAGNMPVVRLREGAGGERLAALLSAMAPVALLVEEAETRGAEAVELLRACRGTAVVPVLTARRPDRIRDDLLRAAEVREVVPVFVPTEPEELEASLLAALDRAGVVHELVFPRDREAAARALGASHRELERIADEAATRAAQDGARLDAARLAQHLQEVRWPEDPDVRELQELVAARMTRKADLLPVRWRLLDSAALARRARSRASG